MTLDATALLIAFLAGAFAGGVHFWLLWRSVARIARGGAPDLHFALGGVLRPLLLAGAAGAALAAGAGLAAIAAAGAGVLATRLVATRMARRQEGEQA